ncbi:hypothetical protein OBBRIDRAFT_518064 [Obba rivulosa]|uniref:Fungal N-terminal domain-containing protein n=1 Tax=Obba rivulosa TaxID=1052685 RepID=A0A8E2B0G0_9APHY|nr:hypothetical protein OBBRIDRAFT_518064 [Obba rivulosa]
MGIGECNDELLLWTPPGFNFIHNEASQHTPSRDICSEDVGEHPYVSFDIVTRRIVVLCPTAHHWYSLARNMFSIPTLSVPQRNQEMALPFFACIAFEMAGVSANMLLEVMTIRGRKKVEPIVASLRDLRDILQRSLSDTRAAFQALDQEERNYAEAILLLKNDNLLAPLTTLSQNLHNIADSAHRVPSRSWWSRLTPGCASDVELDQISIDVECAKTEFLEQRGPMMQTLKEVFTQASSDMAVHPERHGESVGSQLSIIPSSIPYSIPSRDAD